MHVQLVLGAPTIAMPYADRSKQLQAQRASYEKTRDKAIARTRRRAKEVRDYIVAHKKSNPCVDCGEDDWVVLDFDHRPGEKKLFRLAAYKYITMRKLLAEIAKCDIRCANCHRRITYARRLLKRRL